MATPEDVKTYKPLNVDKREMRVLEILPQAPDYLGTQAESKIAVELKHCSLDDPVAYEALSYTWGDPRKKATIRVNSTENFIVRQNLESALRDLRLGTERRVIWIDALCINQDDVAERSEQVKLMRSIYANASVVRSWLDHEIDQGNPAFVRLHSLPEDASVQDLDEDAAFWAPVGEVFANEYWFRIWVQQEIAYAAKWTVQCRLNEISSKSLMTFATLLVMKLWGFYTGPLLDKAKWKALMPIPLRPLLYRSRRDSGQVSSLTFYGPLNRALRECRDLKSTDPRDKIFAMLGMIDDLRDGDLLVNYALSDEQVYINIVKLFVERYHSVEFLREATLGNLSLHHGGFPTWLPDWSQATKMDSFGSPEFSIVKLHANAEAVRSPPARISQGLLQVKGFRIGSVALLLPNVQQESLWAGKLDIPDLVAKFRSFKALSDDIDTPVPTDQTPPDGYRIEYLLRAVTGADGRNIDQRRFQKYSELFDNLISASILEHHDDACTAFSTMIEADPDHFGDLVHYMQESCRGRYFFLTKDLCMGLVPQPASLGDEIWYIIGCTIPIILRNENRKFIVIGEAYVNDCMQWKVVDGVLETPGGVPLTDYQTQDMTLL
jgi:hypothetical protein